MSIREFNDAGYRVIPLYPVTKNSKCGCGIPDCKVPGKHPTITRWQSVPVWSSEQLENIFNADDSYGVICDGLLVIDVDARNGGIASYESLADEIPEITETYIVITGSGDGSKHLYFTVDQNISLCQHLKEYPGIDFKSSGFVVGAGSYHQSGNRYYTYDNISDIKPAPESLINKLKQPEKTKIQTSNYTYDADNNELRRMLEYIDPDCNYDEWLRVGLSLYDATGGSAEGLKLFDEWSSRGEKYAGESLCVYKWSTFGKDRPESHVTIATLANFAMQNGYVPDVEFDPQSEYDAPQHDEELPVDISHVDPLRPPGFAGKIAKYIRYQCMFPREHLAVAATLQVLSSCYGLFYTDGEDTRINFLNFCISDPATGKEAIQQTCDKIITECGFGEAVYSRIKSDKELYNNLLHHQCSYYIIDELGYFLETVKTSDKNYLQNILPEMMSIYTKSNGRIKLSGDMRRELIDTYDKKIQQHEKNGDTKNADAERQNREKVKQGLSNPLLSLIGFTTPSTFDHSITKESVLNGFLSRTMLFREHNSNPRLNRHRKKMPIPEQIKSKLKYHFHEKIENFGDMVVIDETQTANQKLTDIGEYYIDKAEQDKSEYNLAPLYRRAYEQVRKIALALSVPDGVISDENVEYAFRLVQDDLATKIDLVNSNNNELDYSSKLDAVIRSELSEDDYKTFEQLYEKAKGVEKDKNKLYKYLKNRNYVLIKNGQHKRNRLNFEKFYLHNKK